MADATDRSTAEGMVSMSQNPPKAGTMAWAAKYHATPARNRAHMRNGEAQFSIESGRMTANCEAMPRTTSTATLSKCRTESQKSRQRKPLLPCKTRCPTSGRQAASTAKSASHHTRCGPASRSGRDLPLIPAACPDQGRPGWCAGRLTAARRGGTSTSTPRRDGRPPPGPRP